MATVLAMFGTLVMSSGVVLMTTAPTAQAASDKVFVCKYVGEPGVGERLKDGKQPISVSENATDGGWFADGPGFSFVLGPDDTGPGPDDDPPASDCPQVEKPNDQVDTTTETGEKSCETGAQERTRTVTTPHVLSADGHTWVLGDPAAPVYSAWTTRSLTPQERLDLTCDLAVEPARVQPVRYGTTDPTCEVAGTLVVKNQPEGVTATQSPAGTGPGTYTITFTAAENFVLDGQATQTVTVLPRLTGSGCDDEVEPIRVKPVRYGTTDPTCEVAGTLVVKNQPEGVTATQSPAGTGPGTYTITFTAAENFVLDGQATQTVTVLPRLTGSGCDDEVEPIRVKPVRYGTTEPTCEVAGTLVVKNQPEGVTATQSPAGTGPGTYTIAFTTGDGFELDGPATQLATVLSQLTGTVCDDLNGGGVTAPQPGVAAPQPGVAAPQPGVAAPQPGVAGSQPAVAAPRPTVQPPVTEQPPAVVGGVEQSNPPKAAKPEPVQAPAAGPQAAPAPAVAGVQAGPAVPTAVSAGLVALPTAGPVSDELGRTLAAGGLALLVAAGWLATGRRETKAVKA